MGDPNRGFGGRELVACVALLVAVLGVFVATARPASAHPQDGLSTGANAEGQAAGHLLEGSTSGSPDDANGKMWHCNVGTTAAGVSVTVTCQTAWAGSTQPPNSNFNCVGGGGTGWGWGTVTITGGKVQKTVDSWPCGENAIASYYWPEGVTATCVAGYSAGVCSTLSTDYPPDYFDGGSAGDIPVVNDVEPSEWACGRTLRDVGGGQWFADLEAIGPLNPAGPDFETIIDDGPTDFDGWETSWTVTPDLGTGQRVTVPLPPLADMPAGGWLATWEHERRSIDAEHLGETPGSDFDRVQVDTDNNGTLDEWWYLLKETVRSSWITQEIDRARERAATWNAARESWERWRLGGGLRLLDDEDQDVTEAWTTQRTRCAVVIDPSRPSVGGGNDTEGTDDPPPPTPPEGEDDPEDGPDCSIKWGWSILNPANIARWIACSMFDVLKKLFIPDELAFSELWCVEAGEGTLDPGAECDSGLRTAVPFSIVGEAGDAVSVVTGRMQLGLEASPCFAMDYRGLTPDAYDGGDLDALNVKLPTPSGSGCAESATAGVDPENNAGDLFGYRPAVRAGLLVLLYVAVLLKAVRAFSPAKSATEVEPL